MLSPEEVAEKLQEQAAFLEFEGGGLSSAFSCQFICLSGENLYVGNYGFYMLSIM